MHVYLKCSRPNDCAHRGPIIRFIVTFNWASMLLPTSTQYSTGSVSCRYQVGILRNQVSKLVTDVGWSNRRFRERYRDWGENMSRIARLFCLLC